MAVVQNFAAYANTAALLADSTLWATSEAKNTGDLSLDTSVGYAPLGLTQSMRYNWQNIGAVCNDYSISPGQLKIPGSLTEVWAEYIVTFSTNFAVNAGSGSCGAEYKLAAMSDPGGVSRWNLPEMQEGNWVLSSPNGFAPTTVGHFSTSAIWDGNPHVFRCHAKLSSGTGGIMSFWVDGTLIHTETGFGDTGNSQIAWFAPGLNINQGPAISNMHIWWHRIIVYSTDPGW